MRHVVGPDEGPKQIEAEVPGSHPPHRDHKRAIPPDSEEVPNIDLAEWEDVKGRPEHTHNRAACPNQRHVWVRLENGKVQTRAQQPGNKVDRNEAVAPESPFDREPQEVQK